MTKNKRQRCKYNRFSRECSVRVARTMLLVSHADLQQTSRWRWIGHSTSVSFGDSLEHLKSTEPTISERQSRWERRYCSQSLWIDSRSFRGFASERRARTQGHAKRGQIRDHWGNQCHSRDLSCQQPRKKGEGISELTSASAVPNSSRLDVPIRFISTLRNHFLGIRHVIRQHSYGRGIF